MNFYQRSIINTLTFKKGAKFSELNTLNLSNDQFNYHIKKLKDLGFIDKDQNNIYLLTNKGKKLSGELDIFNAEIEKQSKVHLVPICSKEVDGKKQYLMHLRKKHPYYDFLCFPSGKAKYGEAYAEGVIRELEEETGLSGTPNLKLIKHIQVTLKGTTEVIEDKVFYYFVVTDLQNELISKTIEGENYWMSVSDIQSFPNVYPDQLEIINLLDRNIFFLEESIELDNL